MKEIWINRLKKVLLKETRPGAAMKRAWLAMLKKRVLRRSVADPEPQIEISGPKTSVEVETESKTVEKDISVKYGKTDHGSVEMPSEPPRRPHMAPPLTREIRVSEEVPSSPSSIKSKPAGSVKTVSRSIKAVELEAQLPKPQERDNISAEPFPPASQAKRFQQGAAAARAGKTSAKLAGRAAKATASAVKETVSLLIAGGWVSVVVIVLVCGIALAGAFLSGQDRDVSWRGIGPFEWPLPQNFTITSPFDERIDPITGAASFHTGTDIAAPAGTPILAAADGVVTIANSANPRHSYGYYVKLQHEDGYETLYAHCSALCVTAGQEVQQGEVIGFVGSTGDSTGNHLHFEVREDGVQVDAMNYFAAI